MKAATTRSIAPQRRLVSLVNQLDAAFNISQAGGFVKVTSDVEVYGFMLFLDAAGNFLSAVPSR